jgi:hypothetical protein
MPKYKSNAVLMDGTGDPCPRCGQPMRILEHREISDRQRRAPQDCDQAGNTQ